MKKIIAFFVRHGETDLNKKDEFRGDLDVPLDKDGEQQAAALVPFFKNKADGLLQNMKFINQKLDEIIKRRRQEIENTPLDKPLPNDVLTSVITANTTRDVNSVGDGEARPMTDVEIRSLIYDGIIAGTDTVSKIFITLIKIFDLNIILTFNSCYFK